MRVTYNIDTGEEVVDARAPADNIQIIETDITPPIPKERYAGQLQVVPHGDKVRIKTVKRRRKKASPNRHPFLSKREL